METKEKKALWMPKGSVRALITVFTTTSILCAMFLKIPVDDKIYMAWGMVMTYYFAEKKNEDK